MHLVPRTKEAFVIAIALIGSIVAIGARPAEPATAIAPDGVGEDLILVVADSVPAVEDARRLATELGTRFGDVQGMYVDAAANYVINGIHVQTSIDRLSVPCAGTLVRPVLDGVPTQIDCASGRRSVRVLRPVHLRYLPRTDVTASVFPSPCGHVGLPPCQSERYHALLGDAVTFPPASHLVLTAFRTAAGAEGFLELARTLGVGGLVVVNARKLGGTFVGLGQEPHPDGSGPLLGPLPDQASYQR